MDGGDGFNFDFGNDFYCGAWESYSNGEVVRGITRNLNGLLETYMDAGIDLVGAFAYGAVVTGGTVSSIWTMTPFSRGLAAEAKRGGMLNNFPVIEKFTEKAKGILSSITSIKSMDLGATKYQKAGAVLSQLNKYVKDLSEFGGTTYKDVTYSVLPNATRMLELVIPKGATNSQKEAIQTAVQEAVKLGVQLKIYILE